MKYLFSISGCTDHFASNEAEAFSMTRDIVTSFNMEPISQSRGDEPLYSVNDLPGLIPADCSQSIDVIKVCDLNEYAFVFVAV